jgi:MFS family permease
MALVYLLFWVAGLGDPIKSHHAKMSTGWYLAFNIFMWGALLMCQAAAKNFPALAALRILSGAFEAIADPAFMLITSMYYTREEQPSRIAAWYVWNGVGVAGGGLIG